MGAVLSLLSTGAYSTLIDSRSSDMIQSWRNWVAVNKVTASSIVISFNGEIVATAGHNRTPDQVVPVASLSKTITAICLLQVLEGSQYSLRTPVGDILGTWLQDKKIKNLEQKSAIQIGMLLNHTSGFKNDVTQKKGLTKTGKFDQPNIDQLAFRVVRQKLGFVPGEQYHYNNGNYALLGLIIETLTGNSYENVCFNTTLQAVGIEDADLNPEWRIMSSWGGWRISAVDYAKFINAYFGQEKVLGQHPAHYGFGKVSEEVHYGPGVLWRQMKYGQNFWHFGRWRWNFPHKNVRFGAYFSRYVSGWSMVVNYDIHPSEKQAFLLDRALQEAAHQSD